MSELISVVVPVYNCTTYLDDCLNSLISQAWQNWEAILVDDGSTDDSPALCDAWAARDPRIRAIHQPNAGVSAARNAGMAAAQGKYLAFVDADDWVEPTYLQKLYDGICSADIAICDVYDQTPVELTPGNISIRQMQESPSKYTALAYCTYCYNRLYRLALLQRANLQMPVAMKRGEDVWFVTQYFSLCQTACIVPDKLYHYRENTTSATHKFYSGVCKDEAIVMQAQYDFFHKYPLSEAEKQAFHNWEYGKILAVLRYIVTFAPRRQVTIYLKQFLTLPNVRHTFLTPPSSAGKKARLAKMLTKQELYYPLQKLLGVM